ncbi:MAG: hypothetical protein H7Y11_06330 [Armatimonadetes bacterium]|nr:hypothetical protein [Anaerolineae bacterium]
MWQITSAMARCLAVGWMALLVMSANAQPSDPGAIVVGFLEAWNTGDTAAMHAYLSVRSQELYPLELFTNRYTVVNDEIALTGVQYTVGEVTLQGYSATVPYDVVLQSSSFGEINDPGRMMRLVQINGVWGIAWSPMDIFNVLAGDSTLDSSGQLPRRANIYDRNGNLVAWEGTMVAAYTTKFNMPNESDCQLLLADITRRPLSSAVTQFVGYADDTVFFLAELDQDTYNTYAEQLSSICGVDTTRTYETRLYYGGNAMTHITGYLGQMREDQLATYLAQGFTRGDVIGQAGIEGQYQAQLAGSPQRVLRILAPGGIAVLRELGGKAGTEPMPITLTIDRDLQVAVTDAVADAFDYASGNWGAYADAAAAIVLKVDTGEVLALASYPLVNPMVFNPQTRIEKLDEALAEIANDGRAPLQNHVLQNQYAPGSVYKVLTSIAVLNENIIQPEQTFFCDLEWDGRSLGDESEPRSDWRKTDGFPAAGEIRPAQAIMASCNPFFWEFGARLYNTKGALLNQYGADFGLGQAYNLFGGTLQEAPGNLDDPQRVVQAINNAIGQGNVQLPPIQMAVLTAAIANDGTVYKPYLVGQVGGRDGAALQTEFAPEVLNQPDLQPEVLTTVREGMCGAVSDYDYGTAYYVFYEAGGNPTYNACGKTGTAEAGERSNAWFITFAPAEAPEIAIVVAVPRAGREGSEVAAPIARRILDYYFASPPVDYPEWWNTEPFEPLAIPVGGGGN